ncbi:MAG TPA: histidine phosphatase family protein [Gaiella sp.]|uniref:histidine phosphatase family protein n=1 Tax=Gaiella sp. TaxID=2663207 RepID=UPI002D7E43FC|nr:histidine phosphatase family protein [Gaiella sp.]HET9287175.1 histidine phosphatase family protein [Gaiella sp.]
MLLVLVRHAEAEESARGRCYGTLDVGLSAHGRSQCAALARALAPEQVVAVVASPRVRAVETAAAIAEPHGLDVRIEPDLRELDFGDLEGRTYDEIAASLPDLYAAWMTTPTAVRFPGGESYADLHARSDAAVSALRTAHEGETVVAVTHGGIVRAVLHSVLGLAPERIFRLAVDPASVTAIAWLGGEPIVRCVNRVSAGARLTV